VEDHEEYKKRWYSKLGRGYSDIVKSINVLDSTPAAHDTCDIHIKGN
jgi:hypothetical protein